MSRYASKEFSWVEGAAFLCGAIGTQLMSEMIAQWLAYFYSPTEGGVRTIYVGLQLIGFAVAAGRVWDAFTDPLIGVWSDITKSIPGRFRIPRIAGRRRPFIFWGAVGMLFTGSAIWYPPVAHESTINFVFVSAVVCLHWLFFTIANIPLLALGPEVARSQEARMKLGVWWATGMIVGLAIAVIVPPMLIDALSSSGEPGDPTGYQRTGVLFAVAALLLFLMPVLLVRERYVGAEEEAPGAGHTFAMRMRQARREFRDALSNKPFLLYLGATFASSIGVLGMQRVLPNWIEVGLQGDESLMTKIMGPFILTALLTALAMYPLLPTITRRIPIKWLFLSTFVITLVTLPCMYLISVADVDVSVKVMMASAIFAIGGVGQGITYVLSTAIMGEIIDFDERRFGQRREAVFNGVFGIAVKMGQAFALFSSTQIMFFLGNSHENPTGIFVMGPIAGIYAMIAIGFALAYPVLSVTKRTED